MIQNGAVARYRVLDPYTATNHAIDDCIKADLLTAKELERRQKGVIDVEYLVKEW